MDSNTQQLLQQLANKMGTTVQYLWSVLIKQARVSAITDLITLSITILLAYAIFRIHLKLSFTKGTSSHCKYDDNEAYGIIMLVGTITIAAMLLIHLCFMGDTINGFFNPEYWALKEILDSLHY